MVEKKTARLVQRFRKREKEKYFKRIRRRKDAEML